MFLLGIDGHIGLRVLQEAWTAWFVDEKAVTLHEAVLEDSG